MRDIINRLKEYKILHIIVVIIAILLILGIYVVSNGSHENSNIQDTNLVGNVKDDRLNNITKIVSENIKLQDISDIKLKSDLLDIIESGITGNYKVCNRNFVVITTGDTSFYDIQYSIELDHEYNTVVKYKFQDEIDGLDRIRYKIIEFTDSNVIIQEDTDLVINEDATDIQRNGIASALIFNSSISESKKVFILEDGIADETLNSILITDGIYTVVFKDNNIVSNERIDYMDIMDCSIQSMVEQSRNTYNIVLPDGNIIEAHIDELNLDYTIKYNLRFTYDILNGFSAKIL